MHRWFTLALSAFLAGMGGGFYAFYFRYVDPDVVAELVRERFQAGHLIFYGLFMMLVIRFLPEGIWGRVRRMASGKKAGG